jgi:hypothetical protein
LNARTTKDRILSPAPLAKLGYPCRSAADMDMADKSFDIFEIGVKGKREVLPEECQRGGSRLETSDIIVRYFPHGLVFSVPMVVLIIAWASSP